MDRQITQHELLYRREAPRFQAGKRFAGAGGERAVRIVAEPEVALIDARPDRRGGNSDGGEEPLKAVFQQGAVPKPQGVVAQIIELSCGKITNAVEEIEAARASDDWC